MLHKILIVETKGKGYAEQPAFQQRKAFVEQHHSCHSTMPSLGMTASITCTFRTMISNF